MKATNNIKNMEKFYQKDKFKFAVGIFVGILLYKIATELFFK